MVQFIFRWIGGMFAPLIDRVSDAAARLLLKAALFLLAAVAFLVVIFALTLAFAFWVARDMGPIAGALAVAILYALVAALAVFFAVRKGAQPVPVAAGQEPTQAADSVDPETAEQIDAFATPLLETLSRLGLRREQLAVLAGTSLAKRISPVALVALALATGLLIGRNWRRLVSADLLTPQLTDLLARLFGATAEEPDVSSGKADGEAPAGEEPPPARDAA